MSLDQHLCGSTDWNFPSPSSTPKNAAFPDAYSTPKADPAHQSFFQDAWATPRVPEHHTPIQPSSSFPISTPIAQPPGSYTHKIRSPEDPEFHVNHLAVGGLPLPPVAPSQRLTSSPRPQSGANLGSRPVSMDYSQIQTPPPTRDASSRRSVRHGGNETSTPATVIARTPLQAQQTEALFNQTPLGFPALRFSPETVPFSPPQPMSTPAYPQSRLFYDQSESNDMDMDVPLHSDPFGPTPHKINSNLDWAPLLPAANMMNPQAFQALHGISSSPAKSYTSSEAMVPTTAGVDPSMLFSFSSPGPSVSFGRPLQQPTEQLSRQPYETQYMDSLREREFAKAMSSQHSRTSTSSTASFDSNRPMLQRSATDSGLRRSRPVSAESKPSVSNLNIPRRSSPLKRQSGGSLKAIPETRLPRTRLVIENGRARTETDHPDSDSISRTDSQTDLRRLQRTQWYEDGSDTESDEPVTLSRNSSFAMPARRSSKHARSDSNEVQRTNSLKMPRPSSGIFDRPSLDTSRPARRKADPSRRFSMMDFPSFFSNIKEDTDEQMPDSPGDALDALKKVVEGRQRRIDTAAQNTLKAHNQRWSQAALSQSHSSPLKQFDPFSNAFDISPSVSTDAGLTTPSTDRSSLSSGGLRCVCNSSDDVGHLIRCESCNMFLHIACLGYNAQNRPKVFVCVFCTGQTPIARGGRVRGPLPGLDSPLTHKSFRR
ncbi:hypothetical protein M011DRAFT_312140 [Sporormia fimetaria CBS 119925]|uniref:Zinc finger PHD-type domain-containing protein n=1 Tax=Sporormia fimetaria CBS 119925 TaxID=1340428 RepID=A0A6A6VG36_9PLEO|nr:hypothetical protein M011DRAFT_312140 [Sporormia fimetaria CBS 119925]